MALQKINYKLFGMLHDDCKVIIRGFSKCARMAIKPIWHQRLYFVKTKKNQLQNATLVSIEPLDL